LQRKEPPWGVNQLGATYPTKVSLAFRSGGRCAYPRCGMELVHSTETESDQHVAEAAHIRGEKPGAARFDPSMSDDERNAIENLVYLCPTHHQLIDKLVEDWPTDRLIKLKLDHERTVREATEAAFADVAFAELAESVVWVSSQDFNFGDQAFDVIDPASKIAKNGLSSGSKRIIAAGLASQPTVSEFVTAETQLDPNFPERLRAGFLSEYYSLVGDGQSGDTLFEMMCAFAQQGMKLQKDRTAGLAVLVYLFEKCDIFEK